MSYRVVIPRSVQKQISKLPAQVKPRIEERIKDLADEPRPRDCIKLKGTESEYRIRVGQYRIRYEIYDRDLIITIIAVAHRKDVYD